MRTVIRCRMTRLLVILAALVAALVAGATIQANWPTQEV